MKLQDILLLTASLATLGTAGCNLPKIQKEPQPHYKRFESLPVDQVFKDHNGFRIYFTDQNGKIEERKYFDAGNLDVRNGNISYAYKYLMIPADIPDSIDVKFEIISKEKPSPGAVTIFKDLAPDQRGYANILWFEQYMPVGRVNNLLDCYYVEIHIPSNQGLSAGIEVYGGKFPIKESMREIK
nr:hypothetical protein [Nanoarchaeum sp.]